MSNRGTRRKISLSWVNFELLKIGKLESYPQDFKMRAEENEKLFEIGEKLRHHVCYI